MEEAEVRKVAREEIASLCGLVLRRVQDLARPLDLDDRRLYVSDLSKIFGELLHDFSSTPDEPGEVTPGQS